MWNITEQEISHQIKKTKEKNMNRLNQSRITILIIIMLILTAINPVYSASSNMEEEILELKSNFKLEQGKFTGIGKDKNLIVLQIDSLQNFPIGREYNEQEITPNLNRLLNGEDSIYYSNYHELTGLGDGVDSEFVSNNSFYPYLDGAAYEEYEGVNFYSLATALQKEGYRTSLITDDRRDLWNRDGNYKSQGFEIFYSREDFQLQKEDELLLEPGQILNQFLDKIQEEEKFYAYVSTGVRDTASVETNRDENFQTLLQDRDNGIVKYFEMINSVDKKIGNLIEELKERELYEDTVLVIQGASSRIPLNMEEDYLEYFLGKKYEYSQMTNIPLIIHIPNSESGDRIDTLGSQLDFYPTIKNIMGYDWEKSLGFGRDLSNHKGYRAISLGRHKPKGSFFDGENVLLLSRFEEFYNSKAYKLGSDQGVSLDYLEGIYLNLKDEMDLSDKILRNDLIAEESILEDKTYENYLVQNTGPINDIRKLNKMGYKNFIVQPEDKTYQISDLKDIKLIYEVNERNIVQFGNIKINSDYAIISDESLYNRVKGLGFENIILDGRDIEEDIQNEYEIVIFHKSHINGKSINGKKYIQKSDIQLSKNFIQYDADGYLVYSDLIFAFDKEKGVKNKHIIAHAGGEIGGRTYTNSLDAVKGSYDSGIRLMEIDFEWTRDNRLVATHSWDGFISSFFGVPVDIYSYEEFVHFDMINDWQQFYPDLLQDWTDIHSDTFIVTDIKDRNIEALGKIIKNNPYMVNKLIPQVYNFEEYLKAEKLGFENIILTLYLIDADNEEIVQFAKDHRPFAVTMPLWRVGTGLGNALKNEGIFTYTHTLNDFERIGEIESKGIMGIYSDSIKP